jgi:CBS domain-containing protein
MNELSILDGAKVEDVMHEGVVTCSLHAPMTEVARTMAANRIHCVVVWNEPSRNESAELWGVVSDQDLSATSAGRCAATSALTIPPGETLRRAAQLMVEHEVTHLVVVDPGTTKPVGVLSTLDLADALSRAGTGATAAVA